jgi:hypothetical protein
MQERVRLAASASSCGVQETLMGQLRQGTGVQALVRGTWQEAHPRWGDRSSLRGPRCRRLQCRALQEAVVSSAVAALSASSSARASRQQQACTGAVAAGSAAVGAAGGRREQRWSSAACSNQWAQVARSGGGQGELVQTSASRGGLKFQRRSSTLEQGSAQGEIGGKVKSPPLPHDAWGQHWERRRLLGGVTNAGCGSTGDCQVRGPCLLLEKKDFRNWLNVFHSTQNRK